MLVREIHEIELTSVCNLACVYCPHPGLQRPKAHMTQDVFFDTLNHLAWFCRQGTQGEVSLTGIGEATLHPLFSHMLRCVREVVGHDRKLVLSTNGLTMTKELARELHDVKANVYVSLHRPEAAAPALRLLAEARVLHGHNHAFVDSSLDWAGQVDWPVSAKRSICQYLKQGWVAVRQDGAVNTCCMDAHGKYQLASVQDPVGSWHTNPTKLCASCNLIVPKEYDEGSTCAA